MGSCYICCAVTGLPISKDEPAVLLFITPASSERLLRYKDPTSSWVLSSLPFFVKADDFQFSTMLPSKDASAWQVKGRKQFAGQLAYRLLAPRVGPFPETKDNEPDWALMVRREVGLITGYDPSKMMQHVDKGTADRARTRQDLKVVPLTYTAVRRDVWDFIQHRAGLRWRKLEWETKKVFKRVILTDALKRQELVDKKDRTPVDEAVLESLRFSDSWGPYSEFFSTHFLRDLRQTSGRPLLGVNPYVLTVPERRKAVSLMWQMSALIHYMDLLARPLLPLLSMSPQDTWNNTALVEEQYMFLDMAKDLVAAKRRGWE